jgi:hypothetical protein
MNDELPRPSRSPWRGHASSVAFFVAICLALGLGVGVVMFLRPEARDFGPSAAAGPTARHDGGLPEF